MKKITLIIASVLCLCSLAFAATTSPLEGKTFKGEVQDVGATKPDPDTFIFKDGTFRSTACDQFGFTAAPFTVNEVAGTTSFSAMTKNDKGATIHWSGALMGNKITGTALRTTPDGKSVSMTFHANMEHAG